MTSTLLDIARLNYQSLSPAEEALIQRAQNGLELCPSPHSNAVVRSEIIEWICTSAVAKPMVHRHGLAARDIVIVGRLGLINADISFPLQLRNCRFSDDIWLKNTRLKSLILDGSDIKALNADGVLVEANVRLCLGFRSNGEVAFREGVIGGSFMVQGSRFANSEGPSLVCDRIRVISGVFLSQHDAPSFFDGEVRFSGAEIGGNFDAEASSFSNHAGVALTVERIKVGGSLYLRGSNIEGRVIVSQSSIALALDCRGAVIRGPDAPILNCEKASIGSYALLDNLFQCESVRFLSADLQGGLRLTVAKVGSLDLRNARIVGMFEWTKMIDAHLSQIDFRDARLESITDDVDSWPAPGNLQIDGLQFTRFSNCIQDVRTRLKWVSLDTTFSSQAYRQLATVYEREGLFGYAREVLYTFERLTRARQPGPIFRIWSFILRNTTGYGYKLWKSAIIMLLFTIVGAFIAACGYKAKLIAPTEKDANAYFVSTDRSPGYYPRFSASVYSLEHSLPAINLGIASSWSSDTTAQWARHPNSGWFFRYWFWFQTTTGWLLSIFFVASLAGAVKQQK